MISTAIIGAGNMGSALYGGLVAAGTSADVWLCDENEAKLAIAPADRRLADPALASADCIVLAVKPQSFPVLMQAVGKRWKDRFIISVMAGIGMDTIAAATGASAVVRAMPNLGARVRRGITGWHASSSVTAAQLRHAEELFSSIGMAVELQEESLIDGFTAVAGSGPAYVFLLAELLEREAASLGVDAQTGARIARELLASGSLLLEQGEKSAAAWREAVTSKGGTTEAALGVLKERGFADIFHDALAAAADRSRSLARP
ncbi:MAG: pyrroline-5-carboxylate reductase [Candidatus Peribacteraceae bacterium]|nr:pyrroline-5-carboxylate reductase [Candidatus Peribacteraceae bacterium]